MIRFITFLLGREYESCKSCQTLKEQLVFERAEKKELTQTLLNIIQPKITEASPLEINPVAQTSGLFSRRRAALEARDREEASILKSAKHLGRPDSAKDLVDDRIKQLERELNISEEEKKEA